MEDRYKCRKCGTKFADSAHLRRHQGRKTPCEPIIESEPLSKKPTCKYCGRQFTTQSALSRHVKQSCKIANSDDGMDKLFDHTLRRQLALQTEKVESLQTQMTTQMKQMGALVDLLTKQIAIAPQTSSTSSTVTNNEVVQTAQAINNGVVQNNIVAIVPWDGERRLNVSTAHIAAAFAENAMLKEYMRLPEHEMTDPAKAPPYVTELFVDLVRRGHGDPSARNVYLNPRRADQALVHMKTGKWEVVPAAEATRLLMDGVAQTIHQVVLTEAERKQLPTDAQNALSLAGMVYEDEPDEYVKRARGPMAAHLTNVAPAKPITQ